MKSLSNAISKKYFKLMASKDFYPIDQKPESIKQYAKFMIFSIY